MAKILGIDTGTNSLGWALVDQHEDGKYSLLEYGTHIFQEGVKIEKGIESSKAAERTAHRALRKHYWRRKVRKIRLLSILIENHLCPPLNRTALRGWRLQREYPTDELFMAWQRTDDKHNQNPYSYRHICLTTKLDLSDLTQRYILGRAFYHINQRRGFLSNRKEATKESDGTVKKEINELSKKMAAANCRYLGEYFYQLYQTGAKIRGHYTARNEHYLAEFLAICEKQHLEPELVEKLQKAIFYQRPLKSQKQQVGHCTFEPKKPRCSSSHPLYEEFRMRSFVNNIRVQTPSDAEERPLSIEEKVQIEPLFLRKSKPQFPFEDIARKLAGKENYRRKGDKEEKPYSFNYFMDTNVSGCPVTAQLVDIFGEQWLDAICEVYTLAEGKSRREILNDVWHALFFYDDEERLKGFGMERLQLGEEEAARFAKITLPQDYASLSLNTISKILPYMRDYNLRYDEAVLLANLGAVMPKHIWGNKELRESVVEGIISMLHEEQMLYDGRTVEQRLKNYLIQRYQVEESALKKLYHPSMIDIYPRQRRTNRGYYQLGSPRISSVRNPMAMHSLFRLRRVINTLLKEGKIDEDTTIHIEFARELNDANRRSAIKRHQNDNEKDRERCRKAISELYNGLGIQREPSDTDILKYQLWEEQEHKCLYTGEEIGLTDFLGSNPHYDIEHTIPRSVGGDTTKMNLTLCQSRFNREVKGARMPSELANHEEILQRIDGWREKYEELSKQVRKLKGIHAADKDSKNRIIQKRHQLALQRDYWRGKYERFTMTEVPEGFSRRQGTDISVISRYARLYLKSVFPHVYVVKGIATSDFRKIWHIQDEYAKKSRDNHAHHCIDAVTIACIGPYEYGQLAHYYHELEDHEKRGSRAPQFPLPWTTFVQDIKRLHEKLIVSHHSQDNMPKKALRHEPGSAKGRNMGDCARGALHNDSYYGAIMRNGETCYVKRRLLSTFESMKDVESIVDDAVREVVRKAVDGKNIKEVLAHPIMLNPAKGVVVRKVRCYVSSSIAGKIVDVRDQRDQSAKDYKRRYHVENSDNYVLGIYEGIEKGKPKAEYIVSNMINAARHFQESQTYELLPAQYKEGYPLKYKLYKGLHVILYENTPEEVDFYNISDIAKRLYIVSGLSTSSTTTGGKKYSYGMITMKHAQEARPAGDCKEKKGGFKQGEEYRSKAVMNHNQFKALVEGVDFALNELGEVIRLS